MTELHKIEEKAYKAALFELATRADKLEVLQRQIIMLFDLPINTRIRFDVDSEKQTLKVVSSEIGNSLTRLAWRSFHLDTFGKATPSYNHASGQARILLRLGFYHERYDGGFNFAEIGTATFDSENKVWFIDFERFAHSDQAEIEKHETILD